MPDKWGDPLVDSSPTAKNEAGTVTSDVEFEAVEIPCPGCINRPLDVIEKKDGNKTSIRFGKKCPVCGDMGRPVYGISRKSKRSSTPPDPAA